MNLLGHNYIASKILGHVSPNTLLGSHIPDFVPFLPTSVFSFEEIHENHESFLGFIKNTYPKDIDLPLSMMCHSVKHGADEYNREIDNWLLGNNEELINELAHMISIASNISLEVAKGPRLHNYLWCGVDLYLIKNNPNNITNKLIESLANLDYAKTARILAEFYNKEQKQVVNNLKDHFKFITSETFQNTKAFTLFWSKFLSPLKEADNLNLIEGEKLLEHIYSTFEPFWEEIIARVEQNVQAKMKPFLD